VRMRIDTQVAWELRMRFGILGVESRGVWEDSEKVLGSVAAPYEVCEALGCLVRKGWAQLCEGSSPGASYYYPRSSRTVHVQLSEASLRHAADAQWSERHAGWPRRYPQVGE